MKKINFKLFLIFSILSLFTFYNAFSFTYFPIKVGNKFIFHYVYHSYDNGGSHTYIHDYVCNTINDSIINNKTYYLFDNYLDNGPSWLRVDSLTGSLYKLDYLNSCPFYFMENLSDSLLMTLNGHSNSCNDVSVNSINNISRWGITGTDKNFFGYGSSYYSTINRTYNSFFGLSHSAYSWSYSGMSVSIDHYIKGCIIEGIVYGDTLVVDINVNSNEVPAGYSLAQNYPNPFNPSTNIKFNVPAVSSRHAFDGDLVQLKIYDITGKEIAVLLNEKKRPGEYSVTFNAANLPSGIYIYSLFANDSKIDTKKMIILK